MFSRLLKAMEAFKLRHAPKECPIGPLIKYERGLIDGHVVYFFKSTGLSPMGRLSDMRCYMYTFPLYDKKTGNFECLRYRRDLSVTQVSLCSLTDLPRRSDFKEIVDFYKLSELFLDGDYWSARAF